ncbi:MAG: hypothetical protein AVDCRST_MAG67-1147, partial [uncultured Solirubrobacteraceae bacterium]
AANGAFARPSEVAASLPCRNSVIRSFAGDFRGSVRPVAETHRSARGIVV